MLLEAARRIRFLNQWTANAIGIPVIAGPSEATAIGNIMIQAKAAGFVDSLQEMRQIIRESIQLESFCPKIKASGKMLIKIPEYNKIDTRKFNLTSTLK